jgi:L-ascorbate metabolism protein UlaG (beta-lactamase superfamily)
MSGTETQGEETKEPQHGPVTLRYIGHSAFTLECDGKTIAIDPFITGNPSATIAAEDIEPSVILVTHAHDDHVGDTVKIADRTGATVVAQVELAGFLAKKGCETITPNYGGTAQFDGGTVKLTPAWHTSAHSEGGPLGQPAGMVIRFGGKTIYHAGDTALFLDMQLIGDEGIDVAILPIGDFFTMGPDDALRAVKFLRPKVVIPSHYNTFPPIQQDAAKFKEQVEANTQAKCVVLQPGESWTVEI